MPTVTLNRHVVEHLLEKKLSTKQLADRISMLGTDLEELGDKEIHVEIFPDRPDMLSEHGFARALRSFIGVKTGLHKYTSKPSGKQVIVDASVKDVRPYTACAIVRGLQLTQERLDEIIQMQEKLHITFGRNRKKVAIGVYPMDPIMFPVTYKASKPQEIVFHPLEGKEVMDAKKILLEHPTGKKFAHLLEPFKTYPHFVDATKQVLSLVPIINSETTGRVLTSTSDVFVEFSGTDHASVTVGLHMLVTVLADMGGKIESVEIVYGKKKEVTPQLAPSTMPCDLAYMNKYLGLALKEKDLKNYLAMMGIGYEKGVAHIPCYREDILHPVDLAEEIAIAYGYEKFGQMPSSKSTVAQEAPLAIFSERLRKICVGLGLLEVKNYHLISHEQLVEKMMTTVEPVSLLNAIGDHNCLRHTLVPSLLRVLSENQHQEYPHLLFEIGRVFSADKTKETGVLEEERLGFAVCHEQADYTQIRQMIDTVFASLGLKVTVKEAEHPSFVAGRYAQVFVGKVQVAHLGEVSAQVLNNWGLMMPAAVGEVFIEHVFELLE